MKPEIKKLWLDALRRLGWIKPAVKPLKGGIPLHITFRIPTATL